MSLRFCSLAAFVLVASFGCKPAPPVDPPPTTVPMTPANASALPEKSTTPVSVKPGPPKPAPTAPSANVDPDLRDFAARLMEPTSEAGWRINETAALELDRLGSDAPRKLLPLLADEKAEVRRGAAFHLLSSFDPVSREQVAAFTKLLSDQDATIRGFGLQAAKQLSGEDLTSAMPQLTALLDPKTESQAKNRADLARFAGSQGAKGMPFARALAKSATNDPDERVRSAAIFSLTQIAKADDYLPTLQKGLTDKQASVRLVAAGRLRALGMAASPAADVLGKTLADEDERVRTAAAEALVKIGVLAVPVLGEQLGSSNVNARKLALACLSSLGAAAKSELPKIEKLLQDQDEVVREAAKAIVMRLKA